MTDTSPGAPSAAEVSAVATSEAQIAVHWREEEYYPPPPSFVAQANGDDPAICWSGSARSASRTASRSTRRC